MYVKFSVAPSINGTSFQENRTIGGNISFECSASGVPTPTTSWEKDGMSLTNNGGRYAISASRLLITDIRPTDAGDYSCVASNSAGTNKLTSSLLSVHGMSIHADTVMKRFKILCSCSLSYIL